MRATTLFLAFFTSTALTSCRPATNFPLPITQSATPALEEDYSLTPQEVQTHAQQITVRITSSSSGGSGVLIAKKKPQRANLPITYLVLTNKHVVGREKQFQIQTPDGKKHTAQLLPSSITKINPNYDIAVLQFSSSQIYQLAKLQFEDGQNISPIDIPLAEKDRRVIYMAGYPFDSDKIRFSSGKVSQLSDVPFDDGTQIGYVADERQQSVKQGMSGGPIIDPQGIVIGINTIGAAPILPKYIYFDGSKPNPQRAKDYTQANWGLPIYNFLTQLDASILYNYDNLPKVQQQVISSTTGYMARMSRETRQKTVRIDAGGGNGSGVIVAKEGNTYYVLTAKHVVEKKTNIKVITHDQERYTIQPNDTNLSDSEDLAVVKFSSNANYPVAQLSKYIPLQFETVFVGGFPGRGEIDTLLWQWQLNAGEIFDREQGKLATQDWQSFGKGYDLLYTNITYGGMSGGAVWDTEGRVIGIHGSAESAGTQNRLILGNSVGISIQRFMRAATKLKVNPSLLKISENLPPRLNESDERTVITVNISQPGARASAEQWFQYANQLFRIGKYSEAIVAFDRVIYKDSPYEFLGNYKKALALFNDGRYIKSSKTMEKAILSVPNEQRKQYYFLWKYQSVIYADLKQYNNAIVALNEAIRLTNSSDLTLLNEKGILLRKLGRYSDAIKIYDGIISKREDAYTYQNRGNARADSGDKKGAMSDFDIAIKLFPDYAQAYSNRAIVKLDLGDRQGAIADYNRAIKIDPNYSEPYFGRGNVKSNLGDKRGAIEDYTAAIKINPNYAEVYNNRGAIKSEIGDTEGAIADYDTAIKLDSNDANPYYNRGRINSSLRNYTDALLDFDKAISINIRYTEAYSDRGAVKSILGDNQGAMSDYYKAIEINPRYSLAYNNIGVIKYKSGSYKEAIGYFNQAIEIDPKYAEAYSNRCTSKLESGDRDGAVSDCDIAIKLNDSLPDAYFNRGNVRWALGNKQGTMTDYSQSIKLNPKHAESYYGRGLVRASLQDKKGAIVDYSMAIKLNPNYATAYSARGTIKFESNDKQGAIADFSKAINLNPNDYGAYNRRGIVKLDIKDEQGGISDLNKAAQLLLKNGKMNDYNRLIKFIQKIEQSN